MTSATTSRRRFLGRSAQGLGFLAWMGNRPDRSFGADLAAQGAAPQPESGAKPIERGIDFLRPRQDAKGGWSTQREPGITALVVTALLRSGQVTKGGAEGRALNPGIRRNTYFAFGRGVLS